MLDNTQAVCVEYFHNLLIKGPGEQSLLFLWMPFAALDLKPKTRHISYQLSKNQVIQREREEGEREKGEREREGGERL